MLSALLLPFSWLYGLMLMIRNFMYDRGYFHIDRVGVPVISVGNMTAGGTGKTPFVEHLCGHLIAAGKRVAVVSRGYRRSTRGTLVVSDGRKLLAGPKDAGDEAYQIARKFPAAVVIVDERRPRGAAMAERDFAVDAILLDDGFQHRALARDLDIVMIDGRRPPDAVRLLPAGMRREPMNGLRRAHLLVIGGETGPETAEAIKRYSRAPVLFASPKAVRFARVFGEGTAEKESMRGRRCVAFCGIANPERFRATLDKLEMTTVRFVAYRDHHEYSESDLTEIGSLGASADGAIVVTTEKDAVKIGRLSPAANASLWYYLAIETDLMEGREILQDRLNALFARAA